MRFAQCAQERMHQSNPSRDTINEALLAFLRR
jgi:hypothetical protein